jgi:hypothetical protein
MNRRFLFPCLSALLLAVCVLAACGLSTTSDAGAGITPTATPAGPPTPTNVPAGWQVYSGPHFAMAHPADWGVGTFVQGGSTPQQPIVNYAFHPSGGGGPSVVESDNIDAATIQNTYCHNTSAEPTVTLAGLSMRYSTSAQGTVRNWVFIADKGTVYQLLAPTNEGKDAQALDDAVLATFRAQYTTPGCGQ